MYFVSTRERDISLPFDSVSVRLLLLLLLPVALLILLLLYVKVNSILNVDSTGRCSLRAILCLTLCLPPPPAPSPIPFIHTQHDPMQATVMLVSPSFEQLTLSSWWDATSPSLFSVKSNAAVTPHILHSLSAQQNNRRHEHIQSQRTDSLPVTWSLPIEYRKYVTWLLCSGV